MLSNQRIFMIVGSVALVMFSAIVHEVAHGWVAYKLGDPTAKQAGRLTLNPLAHLDPVGSVLLPLLMAWLGGPVFAFAKPVPYNPYNLRHPRRDEVLVALAGPASNLLQGCVGALAFRACYGFWSGQADAMYWVLQALSIYVYVNMTLMFFNLIPLPPLDGSKIVMPLLHGQAKMNYYKIQQYAMPILLVVMYVLPSVLGFDPLGIYLNATAGNLTTALLGA
jgi:Zn-dependent protease